MLEASVEGDGKPVTIDVRFDPKVTNVKRIGSTAKRVLEQDASNNGAVKVVFAEDKGN